MDRLKHFIMTVLCENSCEDIINLFIFSLFYEQCLYHSPITCTQAFYHLNSDGSVGAASVIKVEVNLNLLSC